MALAVLASASGAPGVTTTALGLAMRWPRPVVLVDADPVGGSPVLAGLFQGAVAHPDAMVQLVLAQREGRLGEALPTSLVVLEGANASVLVGPRSHVQAGSLRELWRPLAVELRALEASGQDVIIDAGRLGMAHSATALVESADLALLVCGSGLPELSAARQWGLAWAEAAAAGTGAGTVGCVVVGPGRPYRLREVAKAVGLGGFGSLCWDPRAAARVSRGEKVSGRTLGRWHRSLDALGTAIRSAASAQDPSTVLEEA